jgi:hypothetical protein
MREEKRDFLERDSEWLDKLKIQISESYKKTKDWARVLNTAIHSDSYIDQEAFIDFIEETYQTKVKDVKQLQELTGIYKLQSWDVKLKDYKPVGDLEAEKNAIRELDEVLTRARFNKFKRAIKKALLGEIKYKDLIQIKPEDYGLTESWEYCYTSDQYNTILWAISDEYLLAETTVISPKPRDIAEYLEAPLSVVMEAFLISRKVWKA